ncbi:calcineurin-like phosphoesterase C-terminal domain-containing protein [Planctomicrobium sp. SH527]|uniref:calcineurin-like phosphoesterase C-terminal domain-containing protein n=1 Tax=Planctomicrobium sp. SH527 TaxID=3448123 RepID=UPI003F5B7AEE
MFHDANGNGRRDEGESGIAGVGISNATKIVETGADGSYQIPIENDSIVFVIKPSGWAFPHDENNLARFYYIHRPNGSPDVHFKGVPATGPLPSSIDFPLTKSEEKDEFKVIFFGDTQSRDNREVEYTAHKVLEQIIRENKHDAQFGVTLGDVVFDDLSVFEPLLQAVGKIGIPWVNVLGNHDMNYDSPDDKHSDETFERVFGPSYYSFNYGPVHFIVTDDVVWVAGVDGKRGRYHGGFGEAQLEFIKNDLARVPKDSLVVVMMHIPVQDAVDKDVLFRLLEDRPNTLSLSAHTHQQRHHYLGEEQGWKGSKPHHHINHGTVCGSWWAGTPDHHGIPHATMSDGTPNGYSVITFSKDKYKMDYRVAGAPVSYQMNIYAPEAIKANEQEHFEVSANVFNGSSKSQLKVRIPGKTEWIELQQVSEPDPNVLRLKQLEAAAGANLIGRKLPNPANCSHLWKGEIPTAGLTGSELIEVQSLDQFGQTSTGYRLIRVE